METGVSVRQAATNILGFVAVLGGLYLLFRYFGITEIHETIEQAGVWAPVMLVLAKISTIVIAPLGGAPLYPLAGALFGFWKGFALMLLGDTIGCTISFFISRLFGRRLVEKLMRGDGQFLNRALRMMSTTRGFFAARICFLPLPEVTAYGAGLTRMPFLPFIIITGGVGIVPVMLFVGLGSVLTLNLWWTLPLAIVTAVVLIPVGIFLFKFAMGEWEKTKQIPQEEQ